MRTYSQVPLRAYSQVPHRLFFSKIFHYYWWLFFYLMVKSSKSFVKIRSNFQIALFFWFFLFYRNFQPSPISRHIMTSPLIWIYIMLQFKKFFYRTHLAAAFTIKIYWNYWHRYGVFINFILVLHIVLMFFLLALKKFVPCHDVKASFWLVSRWLIFSMNLSEIRCYDLKTFFLYEY